MSAAFAPHRMAFVRALRRLLGKPLGTFLSALVVGIALTLPALGYVLIDNLGSLANGMTGKPEISVFLNRNVDQAGISAFENRLRADKRVSALRFVSRDAALKELAARGAFADVTGALPENPLPDAFVLEPVGSDPAVFESLRVSLTAMPEVMHVQLDSVWVERLHAVVELGQRTALMLAGLLGTVLIIVTFNTIRLQILTQRHEISVSLLMGATRGFVRRPFLYFGFLQGMLGGILAWGLVEILILVIAPHVQTLARTYNIVVDLHGPNAWQSVSLILFAAILGWVGAALSVRRHLHDGMVD